MYTLDDLAQPFIAEVYRICYEASEGWMPYQNCPGHDEGFHFANTMGLWEDTYTLRDALEMAQSMEVEAHFIRHGFACYLFNPDVVALMDEELKLAMLSVAVQSFASCVQLLNRYPDTLPQQYDLIARETAGAAFVEQLDNTSIAQATVRREF